MPRTTNWSMERLRNICDITLIFTLLSTRLMDLFGSMTLPPALQSTHIGHITPFQDQYKVR